MIPPTVAAARNTRINLLVGHPGFELPLDASDRARCACTVTISQLSRSRRLTIAEPAMPRCPATQHAPTASSKLLMAVLSAAGFLGNDFQIGSHHICNQLRKGDLVLPTQNAVSLRCVAEQQINLCRPEVAAVDLDQRLSVG